MSRPRRAATLAAVALGAVATLAACGGTPASAGPATPVPPGTVAIEATEYDFTPSTILVFAGNVRFSVKNAGNEAHEFEIFSGETSVGKLDGLGLGLTKDLAVTLQAGTYTFVCKLNGHDQLGMKGSLTVQ